MKHHIKFPNGFAENAVRLVRRHAPEILTGIGIAGMISTTVMAVKSTPKALILLEEAKAEKMKKMPKTPRSQIKLNKVETIKVCWKTYIPAVITGVTSTACLIGGSSVSRKRNTALAAAYTLSETALQDYKMYKEKVTEVIGETKEEKITNAIAQEKIERHPVVNREVIVTGAGKTLCYETTSKRYFESDIETIKHAINNINKRMIEEMYISLNDWYYELGLEETSIGDDLGWDVAYGLLEPDFTTTLASDGRPCLVIELSAAPRYDYRSLL